MASIYHAVQLDAPADAAWDFLDRYTRAEVHVFSACVAERCEGEYRVVTLTDGQEIWERNVTVDPVRRRASYTVLGLNDVAHHHAEMRIDVDRDGSVTLVWVTDFLPHEIAGQYAANYAALFDELVAAATAHGRGSG